MATSVAHEIEKLWSQHAPERGYPSGVVAIRKPIPGIAFFPGGYGLWRLDVSKPIPPLPIGGIMVLGHDFHSAKGYRASLKLGRESETQPTWRNLLSLLGRAGIEPSECFFTNVYMGLRAGSKTTGPFPGSTDPEFVEHCIEFLGRQLSVQRPSLVITLGVNVPPLLARLSDDLVDWRAGKGFDHLDTTGPLRTGVQFDAVPNLSTTVVSLVHPSLRHLSIGRRRYLNHIGDDAEVAMLRDGTASRARIA